MCCIDVILTYVELMRCYDAINIKGVKWFFVILEIRTDALKLFKKGFEIRFENKFYNLTYISGPNGALRKKNLLVYLNPLFNVAYS